MSLNRKITRYTGSYWDKIGETKELIRNADFILIGAGSGASASGGLNYADQNLCKRWFPEYYSMGLHTILDIQSMFWRLTEKNVKSYWGYWANHIYRMKHNFYNHIRTFLK